MHEKHPSNDPVSVPRVLAGLAIDYFRWTQLVPMITAWTFLLVMVGAVLLVSFQQQSFSLIEWGAGVYERNFGPIESRASDPSSASAASPEAEAAEAENGTIRFSDEDFMPWVLKAWGLAAFAGWLIGMLFSAIFGPREPMRLKSKLVLAAMPAAACVALFWLAYFFGSEEFHGSSIGWILLFVGFPLGVWLISAYSLAVSHGLGVLQRHVAESA